MANIIGAGSAGRIPFYNTQGTDLVASNAALTWSNITSTLQLVAGKVEIIRNTYDTTLSSGYYYQQSHTNQLSGNTLTAVRTRGSSTAPGAVLSGDVLGTILFAGYDGITAQPVSFIQSVVDGSVATGNISGGLQFGVRSGNSSIVAAQLNKLGQFGVNTLTNYSGSVLNISSTGIVAVNATTTMSLASGGAMSIIPNGALTLKSGTAAPGGISIAVNGTTLINPSGSITINGTSVAVSPSGNITLSPSGNVILGAITKVKISGGTVGQMIVTDGAGNLQFSTAPQTSTALASLTDVTISAPVVGQVIKFNGSRWVNDTDATGGGGGSGGSITSRTTVSGTSTAITNGGMTNIIIPAFKGFNLYKITVSNPAWVRVYSSAVAQATDTTADQTRLGWNLLGRAISTDPSPSAGVLAEVVTTTLNETVSFSPAVICYNNDLTVSSNTYITVQNLTNTNGTQAFTVTLTLLQTEA